MPSTEPTRHDVPIALLYQAQGLGAHLKQALADLGAPVVYDSPAASFDRAAMDATGARVVLINLDPGQEDDFDHFDELLTDDALRVVFNDSEVSSRLQGWDQARWARHLAAKILGGGELNPPRPPGAEAVPVRVKTHVAAATPPPDTDRAFQIEGGELARALAADTGESLQRTRAALQTSDEPIAAQLVDAYARPSAAHDAPTVVLPRVDVAPALADASPQRARHDAPTLELKVEALQVAPSVAAPPAIEPMLDDFIDAGSESITLSAGDGLVEEPRAGEPDGDGFDTIFEGLSLVEMSAPADAPDAVAEAPAGELDPEFAASLRDFGLLGGIDDAAPALDVQPEPAAESMQFTDEFGDALGALSLEPLDDEAPSQREAPPVGLDDMLREIGPPPTPGAEAPSAAPPPAAKSRPPSPTPPPKVGPVPPPPAPAKTAAQRITASSKLSLADADAPPPAPAPIAEAPSSRRSLDDFDLSSLSLTPMGDEPIDDTPITGRAHFQIDDKDRRAAKQQPAAAAGVPPAAGSAENPETPIEFELRGLREPQVDPEIAAELAAMVAAAEALPLGQPVRSGVQQVWVLGASIGGPEAVREFLAAVPPATPALFVLAQHMGADFLDLMVQQLARATTLPVRTVSDGDIARHGEVIVVPLVERMLIDADGVVRLSAASDSSPYNPSIDRVMRDVADRFGPAAGAIIFSGMAHDAIDGAVYMRERGGTIWVQDPATCVISSMVDGAQDAGVVSLVGSPLELAQALGAETARRAAGG